MKKYLLLTFVGLFCTFIFNTANAQTTNFQANLTIGSTGSDVISLQNWLESKGYLVMPVGVAKGYFGALTRSALIKFQIANGITPAVGYFGPITRGRVTSIILPARIAWLGGEIGIGSVSIISPVGGERWKMGSTQTIEWSLFGSIPTGSYMFISAEGIDVDESSERFHIAKLSSIPENNKYEFVVPTRGNIEMPGSGTFPVDSGKYEISISIYDKQPCVDICLPGQQATLIAKDSTEVAVRIYK